MRCPLVEVIATFKGLCAWCSCKAMARIFLLLPALTAAHMSLINPVSRNAIDRALPLWEGGKW